MSPIVDYLTQTALTLAAALALGALVYLSARRLPKQSNGPLELVAQLALGGRRNVYLVRAGERLVVLAASESGLVDLGEYRGNSPASPQDGNAAFRDVLRSLADKAALVGGRKPASGDVAPGAANPSSESSKQ